MTPDDATLTCERCQHIWQRRNLNKLPKACPKCRSPYWQKPLTTYWTAKRQEYAAAKQARQPELKPPNTGLQDLTARQKKFSPIITSPDTLKVYHAWEATALQPIKPQCTYWLPENINPQPSSETLYQLGNTIATTRPGVLSQLKYLIQKGLPHNKVLWITIVKTYSWQYYTQAITTFRQDGSEKDRWFYSWPPPESGQTE